MLLSLKTKQNKTFFGSLKKNGVEEGTTKPRVSVLLASLVILVH